MVFAICCLAFFAVGALAIQTIAGLDHWPYILQGYYLVGQAESIWRQLRERGDGIGIHFIT